MSSSTTQSWARHAPISVRRSAYCDQPIVSKSVKQRRFLAMVSASPAASSPVPRTRILIADDNAVVRTVMHTLIETKRGLHVCGEAVTGPDAIQQAKDLQPDLVLLDLRMPGMNGITASPLIKQAAPNARIVLFTMYDSEINETVKAEAHIDLLVRKSDGIDGLLRMIEVLIHSNTWFRQSEA